MKINGNKTYIGMIAAGLFGIGIAQGWMSWDDGWVQTIAAVIGMWSGVAIKHSTDKKKAG